MKMKTIECLSVLPWLGFPQPRRAEGIVTRMGERLIYVDVKLNYGEQKKWAYIEDRVDLSCVHRGLHFGVNHSKSAVSGCTEPVWPAEPLVSLYSEVEIPDEESYK